METYSPSDACIQSFKSLCAELGAVYVGFEPGRMILTWHPALWLFDPPGCNGTTWSCLIVEEGQRAELASSIAACRSNFSGASSTALGGGAVSNPPISPRVGLTDHQSNLIDPNIPAPPLSAVALAATSRTSDKDHEHEARTS